MHWQCRTLHHSQNILNQQNFIQFVHLKQQNRARQKIRCWLSQQERFWHSPTHFYLSHMTPVLNASDQGKMEWIPYICVILSNMYVFAKFISLILKDFVDCGQKIYISFSRSGNLRKKNCTNILRWASCPFYDILQV